MSKLTWKGTLKILAIVALASAAASSQKAAAANCPGDPFFFCDCARAAAQQCYWDYQFCGGFQVEGCAETYWQCRADSGIDQCE